MRYAKWPLAADVQLIRIVKIIMIRCIILMVLAIFSIVVFADWEPVSLDDKVDFNIRCVYKAKCLVLPEPRLLLSTKFFNVSSKKIGYLPNASGKLFNAFVMADNKTVLTFKTEEGRFIKNWKIIELKKKCLSDKSEANFKQKNDATKTAIDVLDKSSLDDIYTDARFFIE